MRMYTVDELESISGLTRRTISDYTAKGLLAGPSHRGRGARYSQADVDALRIIPKLRTLMKKEFGTLRAVSRFIGQLSTHELHSLAGKTNGPAFVLEVRQIRVRHLVISILPQAAPERISQALARLTPEQLRGVDAGRYQLGAVLDLRDLLGNDFSKEESATSAAEAAAALSANVAEMAASDDEEPGSPYWSVNWLDETVGRAGEAAAMHMQPDQEPRNSLQPDGEQADGRFGGTRDRIADIAERLDRIERLLAV